ncbi:MAG: RluA family pseudouridine synthase [Erysipelotrichaceae bacterium]|nr:RluA family pseudouridine synthase [Erysipelotrichaceae bacterium]
MINILFEDNHLLVVEKPVNIPVQEDSSKDKDLLTILKEYLKVKYNKPNNVYLGLVHRLDRPVGGVMVFAKTSKAASRLSKQIQEKTMKKIYNAVIVNSSLKDNGTLIDYLIKNTKTNTVSVVSENVQNSKKAILHYNILANVNNLSLVEINLETGRPHQIRVQFASRNSPIWGDQRYNKNAIVKQQIALYATSLSFTHPISKEELTFKNKLPNTYPWSLFMEENYGKKKIKKN